MDKRVSVVVKVTARADKAAEMSAAAASLDVGRYTVL